MPARYGGSRVPKLQPTPIRAARSLGGMPSRREARRHKSGHHSRGDASPKDRIRQHWTRSRVLLLNATFEPLTALPLRRAVVMLVCGKAEVVHGHPSGMVLHSASASVQLPSVIRLNNYVRVPYRAKVPLTRAALMHRDGYRCAYCGGKAESIDHVVPNSRGGDHSWLNFVASGAKSNHRKADRLLSELGWSLRVEPVAQRRPHWRLLAEVNDALPEWQLYLGSVA